MGTSSARPESLVAYTAHTLPHLDEAMRRIEGIDEVARKLRATSGGYIPMASWTRLELELERNEERYRFLRWGQQAFDGSRVVPPAP